MSIEDLKEKYPIGTRVTIKEMRGEKNMPKGLKGTVVSIDDAGQIHVSWDNGSSLALTNQDSFELSDTIRVLLVKPGEKAEMVDMGEDLDSMQQIVGGMGRTGLEKLYLRYCYELGYLPKYTQRPTMLSMTLKEDLLMCDKYCDEAKLLSKYGISTDKDLEKFVHKAEQKMDELLSERDDLRTKARRRLPETEIENCRGRIAELTAELRELRKETKLCADIEKRSGIIGNNLEKADRERKKEERQI